PPRTTHFPYTTLFRSNSPVILERDFDPEVAAEIGHLFVRLDSGVHQRHNVQVPGIPVAAVRSGVRPNLWAESSRRVHAHRFHAKDRKSTRLNSSHDQI